VIILILAGNACTSFGADIRWATTLTSPQPWSTSSSSWTFSLPTERLWAHPRFFGLGAHKGKFMMLKQPFYGLLALVEILPNEMEFFEVWNVS